MSASNAKLFLEKILQFNETGLFCIFVKVETVSYRISVLLFRVLGPAQLSHQRRNYSEAYCGSYFRVLTSNLVIWFCLLGLCTKSNNETIQVKALQQCLHTLLFLYWILPIEVWHCFSLIKSSKANRKSRRKKLKRITVRLLQYIQ